MESSSAACAALTLIRYPRSLVPFALFSMGLDRFRLRRVPGLRFWRLLGTSQGLAAGRWSPYAYGLFTVWDSPAALTAFEQSSALVRRQQRVAQERWTVRLAPVRWHGIWAGRDPFAGMAPAVVDPARPWAILTRATVRVRYVRRFLHMAEPVTQGLAQQPALLLSLGMGETPFIHQATFSLWQHLPAVQQFAYSTPVHTAAMKRTHLEGWYREEFFARFQPFASSGTWGGVNPLASLERQEM